MTMKRLVLFLLFSQWICACAAQTERVVQLTHGQDHSAGGGLAYIISTPAATYYLEKNGGGLSSMLDKDFTAKKDRGTEVSIADSPMRFTARTATTSTP